jgi:hypothetical protein
MNDSSNELRPLSHRQQGGPPLVVVGGVTLGLFVVGVIVSAALGGVPPNPLGPSSVVIDFYGTNSTAVQAGAVFLFASSVPLLIYSATVSARLRQLGITAPGATIALAGGIVASMTLGLSGLLAWVLSRSAIRTDGALVQAFSTLSFLAGGPGHVVPLGLLVAGVAVPALIVGLLPRPLAWTGLVIAAVAELSTLALVSPSFAILLPIARFPALIWLVAAGALLPARRPRANAS